MDWDTYKFRCHRLGDLAGKPTKAEDLVTQTTASYLYQVYDEVVNGIREVVSTKELRKGLQCEQDSIDLVNRVHQTFFEKNDERKENDYIQGECDINAPTLIVDIKTSWNMGTFRKASLTKNNYWQMVGYLWLWNKRNGWVAYVLTNTPDEMIADAQRTLAWQMGMIDDTDPEYIAAAEQIEANMTFDRISPDKRVRCFPVELYQDEIAYMKERITAAREFLKRIEQEENNYPKIDLGEYTKTTPLALTTEEHVVCASEAVSAATNVEVADILGKSRKSEMIVARHMFRILLLSQFKKYTHMAKYLGVKHATVLNSIKSHENDYKYDKRYQERFDHAKRIYSEATCRQNSTDGS